MPTTNMETIDVQQISNDLRAKMQELERLKAVRTRHEGALALVMNQLQNDHGVNTIERAEALLARRRRIEANLLRRLQEKLEQLQNIEQRIADAHNE